MKLLWILLIGWLLLPNTDRAADTKQLVLLRCRPSHPAGMHEFRAG